MILVPSSLSPKASHPHQAFTLIEVVMALSILALLSGMVFGIMRVSLKTAFETRKMQMENDEVSRFIMLSRHTLQNLPGTAILSLKVIETGDPVQQELTISGVPEAFAFGSNPMSYKDTILGMRPDVAATEASTEGINLYYVGLSREDLIPNDPSQKNSIASGTGEGLATPDDQGRFWMPLLSGVTSITWRFYKEDGDTWEEEWDSTDLPQLVEMNLMLQGRTVPIRSVFALPTTKLTAANPSLAPKTSTSSSSSNSSTQGGGGGGNNNGNNGNRGGERGGDRGQGGDSRGGERGGPPGGERGQGGGDRGGPGRGGDGGGRPGGGGGQGGNSGNGGASSQQGGGGGGSMGSGSAGGGGGGRR